MRGSNVLAFSVIMITLEVPTNAKTVVFLPPPGTSYFVYHTNIAGELARMGHDVHICVPHFLLPKDLVKDKDVKVLVYGEHLGNLDHRIFKNTRLTDIFFEDEFSIELIIVYRLGSVYAGVANDILSDKVFIETVRGLKPDLIVVDSIPFNMNMIILPYMLDIPYALIGTFHDIVLSKVPYSSAAPYFASDNMSDRTPFFGRVYDFFYYLIRVNFDYFYDSRLVSKFAPHKPYKSINEIAAGSEIFIAELDHILDYPRPTLPNTKLVGGSSASPPNPLTGEFKTFVEESENGIIVVSFGGSILNIPDHIASKMVSAFKLLDLRVVWRINVPSPDPDQILTSNWIPQNDLIGHNKTKLFVSHCGKNGQYEALYHAVPMLCLPIFADQPYNSERIVIKQLGLRADMRRVSAVELAGLMEELIHNRKYSENIMKASRLYKELFRIPKRESAYWLDHVMKYGGEHMRSAGQLMPYYQLYVLDVIAFLAAAGIVILLLIYALVIRGYRYYQRGLGSVKNKHD